MPLSVTVITRRSSCAAARTTMMPVLRTPLRPWMIAFSRRGCIRKHGTIVCFTSSAISKRDAKPVTEPHLLQRHIRARQVDLFAERALRLRVAPEHGAQQIAQHRQHAACGMRILFRQHRDVLQAVEEKMRIEPRPQHLESGPGSGWPRAAISPAPAGGSLFLLVKLEQRAEEVASRHTAPEDALRAGKRPTQKRTTARKTQRASRTRIGLSRRAPSSRERPARQKGTLIAANSATWRGQPAVPSGNSPFDAKYQRRQHRPRKIPGRARQAGRKALRVRLRTPEGKLIRATVRRTDRAPDEKHPSHTGISDAFLRTRYRIV